MDKPSLSSPKVAAMALLAAVAIPVVSASAQQTTTFVIDGTEGASTYTNTTNGITMTLSDPAEADSGNNDFAFGFDSADSFSGTGEMNLTSTNGGFVTAFNLSFSTDVQVVGYNVGAVDIEDATPAITNVSVTAVDSFSLSIGGVPTSLNNDLSTTGDHTVNGVFLLPADTDGRFDTNDSITDGTVISLESITVETIPEPRTWTFLGLGGLFALAARRWQRRRTA